MLLDDDVMPEPIVLDAYVGARLRYPAAVVFVGLTVFPPGHDLLVASDGRVRRRLLLLDRDEDDEAAVGADIQHLRGRSYQSAAIQNGVP